MSPACLLISTARLLISSTPCDRLCSGRGRGHSRRFSGRARRSRAVFVRVETLSVVPDAAVSAVDALGLLRHQTADEGVRARAPLPHAPVITVCALGLLHHHATLDGCRARADNGRARRPTFGALSVVPDAAVAAVDALGLLRHRATIEGVRARAPLPHAPGLTVYALGLLF